MPSFNQGQFIEEAMRSVLDQGYPNLELLVLDGGSTDGTLDVLQRYADHLAYGVSEPDRAQAHVANKGFERSTGAILGSLNTDDRLAEGALETAARTVADVPGAMAAVGYCSAD